MPRKARIDAPGSVVGFAVCNGIGWPVKVRRLFNRIENGVAP